MQLGFQRVFKLSSPLILRCRKYNEFKHFSKIYFPGRAVRFLHAPQNQTSSLPASGSSVVSFAMKIQKSGSLGKLKI